MKLETTIGSERMTWAMLTRGDEIMNVPYACWSDVVRLAAGHWPEDPVMDVIVGAWQVSHSSVSSFLGAVRETDPAEFERATGCVRVSPGISCYVTKRVFSPDAAREAKARLINFLEQGGFTWRIITL